MKILSLARLLGALLALLAAEMVSAAPRVVVSVAPLHSLVAALMEGAGEPALLLEPGTAAAIELTPFQKARMIAADMTVWAGPGLETGASRTLERMPALKDRLVTLSDHVPLLPRPTADPLGSRQETRDPAFWGDPRLAMAAVRYLTPQLVLLDPDHQELYLDNEIALLKRLRALEQEVAHDLAPVGTLPSDMLAAVDPYFSHRFLPGAVEMGSLRPVALNGPPRCVAAGPADARPDPGPELYFDTLRRIGASVKACAMAREAIRTAAAGGKEDSRI